MDPPTRFAGSDLSQLYPNDTIPSNIDPSTISYFREFLSVPLAIVMSNPCTTVSWEPKGNIRLNIIEINGLAGDQGWATLETILIRTNTDTMPSGRFPVYRSGVGYDAAVCVQRYESWIVETSNTSVTSPSVLRVVGKGNGNPPLSPKGNIRGTPIVNTRYLNMTGNGMLFGVAHRKAMEQMVVDTYSDYYFLTLSTVGPAVPPRTIFLLTSTYSIGHCSHRRHSR